jgi:hypothetical protein
MYCLELWLVVSGDTVSLSVSFGLVREIYCLEVCLVVSGDTLSMSVSFDLVREMYCLELWLVVSGDTVSVSVSVLVSAQESEEDKNEQVWKLVKETSWG